MATAKNKSKKATEAELPSALSGPQIQTRGEREAAKRARKLRRQTSADEQKLWHQLRDKQLGGFRFRRQRSIGKYIVDFVCDDAKLIVELSDKPKEASPSEKARAAYFKAQGYLVLHLLNNEVSAHIKTGLESIRKHLKTDLVEVAEAADMVTQAVAEVVKKAKRAVKAKVVVSPETGTEAAAETAGIQKKSAAKKPAAAKSTTKSATKSTTKSTTQSPATKKPVAKKPAAKKIAESDQ